MYDNLVRSKDKTLKHAILRINYCYSDVKRVDIIFIFVFFHDRRNEWFSIDIVYITQHISLWSLNDYNN
jgi:hypothetical protein